MAKGKNPCEEIVINAGIFPYTKSEADELGIPNHYELNKSMSFPMKLRALRKELGLTQQEVGDLIGLTKTSIGLYENGDNIPDVKTLYKLTELFNVSADYLIGKTDVRSANIDIAGICNTTGLSEEAIIGLSDYRTYKEKQIVFLNYLLKSLSFWKILDYIEELDGVERDIRNKDPKYLEAVSDFKFGQDRVILMGEDYKKYVLQLMKGEFNSLLNKLVKVYLEREVKSDGERKED